MKRYLILFICLILLGCANTVPPISGVESFLGGQKINEIDESGMTPLTYAVWQLRDVNAVKILLERGADINIKNAEGLTALELALNIGRADIVNVLIKAGAKLFEPGSGKSRLFFIGEGVLLVDTWIEIGNLNKNIKNGRMDFIDVNPGSHTIIIPVSWYQTQPRYSVNVEAGRTYYFTVSPTTAHNVSTALGFGLIPAVIIDRIGETGPVAITQIEESLAKEKVKVLLN